MQRIIPLRASPNSANRVMKSKGTKVNGYSVGREIELAQDVVDVRAAPYAVLEALD